MDVRRERFLTTLLTVVMVLVAASPQSRAQLSLPGLGGTMDGPPGVPSVLLSAQFTAPTSAEPGRLLITADIPTSYHIYAIDQPPGGPQRTLITLDPSPQYELAGPFQASPPPMTEIATEVWAGLEIRKHSGQVTWYAAIQFRSGADPKALRISGNVAMQVCDPHRCVPLQIPFSANVGPGVKIDPAGEHQPPHPVKAAKLQGPTYEGQYRDDNGAVTIRGHFEPAAVPPGGRGFVVLTADPDGDWHIYALADRDPKQISKPTLITIDQPAGMKVYRAATGAPVIEQNQEDIGLGVQRYYRGPVTWKVQVDVPADTAPGQHLLGGIIGYQVCRKTGCKPPAALRFQATLRVDNQPASGTVPLVFAKLEYGEAARIARQLPVPSKAPGTVSALAPPRRYSLGTILLFALAGGLILNLMPCVLPVIGLKILSFFQQGGQKRGRILVLNLWYSAGLLAVFLVLATLAVSVQLGLGKQNYGWGELYTLTWFKVLMTALVFTMALSFLGVWEIPIPGFAATGKATQLAAQEGPAGALFKGIFTTLLATPCSGPLLGPVFGFTMGQTPMTTYLVFGFVGLGMASPYLLIGAFPGLIRFLPKPGAWMETFKQLMGFLLLGTVV